MSQITLWLSADLYKGPPIADISVDWVPVVSVEVWVQHGTGSQAVMFSIDQPGDHAITVAYANDLYEGSRDSDRNLFLDAASLDGVDLYVQANMCEPMAVDVNFTVPGSTPIITDPLPPPDPTPPPPPIPVDPPRSPPFESDPAAVASES